MQHAGHADVVDVVAVAERQFAASYLAPEPPTVAARGRLELLALGDRVDRVEDLDVAGAATQVGAEMAGHVVLG